VLSRERARSFQTDAFLTLILVAARDAMNDKLKDTIQDCNINFLLGSGLSCPYLKTLGNLESLLTDLETRVLDSDPRQKIIRVSLYKRYFDEVIRKNLQILEPDVAAKPVLQQYTSFLNYMNSILLKRKVTLLSKEINLFTTNIDIFLDKALEDLSLEYNDGFNGRFKPTFSLSNFKTSRFKKSLQYDKIAELPVFNLLKLHGSLSWELRNGSVTFSIDLNHVKEVGKRILSPDHVVTVADDSTIATLLTAAATKKTDAATDAFLEAYEQLLIVVNPTKEKFKHTLMNQTYYELLRLYNNELEKENTVLFVMGFSFADEHIREITLRAANSNPTLMIYIVAYSSDARTAIEANFGSNTIRNSNVHFIAPEQDTSGGGAPVDKFQYDLQTINKRIYGDLLQRIDSDD
jgi:hypothetical protein